MPHRDLSRNHKKHRPLWTRGVVLASGLVLLSSGLSACGGTSSVYRPPQSDKWTVYFGSSDGSLHALNANDGSQRWKASSKSGVNVTVPMTVNDRIVAFENGSQGIESLRADTGAAVKTCQCAAPEDSLYPPTIVNGVLYSIDARDNVQVMCSPMLVPIAYGP